MTVKQYEQKVGKEIQNTTMRISSTDMIIKSSANVVAFGITVLSYWTILQCKMHIQRI